MIKRMLSEWVKRALDKKVKPTDMDFFFDSFKYMEIEETKKFSGLKNLLGTGEPIKINNPRRICAELDDPSPEIQELHRLMEELRLREIKKSVVKRYVWKKEDDQ
jgi:hypothetical protein